MMTMMTMILTTWMDRDRIQHPEGLMTVTMQIQAIPRKVAKARTVARRILDADNTNSIEQLVAAASPATSNSAPLGEHLFSALSKCLITPPSLPLFFSLTLDKAGMAGTAERSAGEEELQSSSDALGLRAYIRLAQRVHPLLQPFTKLRRELKALRRSAQETERSTEQEQEHSDQESAEARAPPFEHALAR